MLPSSGAGDVQAGLQGDLPFNRFDAWVSFVDKGFDSEKERQAALKEVERAFSPRALRRRRLRRTLPGMVDDFDLPVSAAYIAGVAATGAEPRVKSRWLNGISVLATRDQVTAIESLPGVREVTDVRAHVPKGQRSGEIPVYRHRSEPPPDGSSAFYGRSETQNRQLALDRVHSAGFGGEGVLIAVIDTGFLLSHPAFNNPDSPIRIAAEWDFMDNDGVVAPETGDSPVQHEHGTLILGAIAANAPGELVGSAPEATYILCKAEDDAAEYFLEEKWFVTALEFAEASGADVVTSSVVLYEGYEKEQVDGRTSVMAFGWNRAVANGIIGLQGGGNFGHDDDPDTHQLVTPAAVPGIITVGAVDSEGRIARFSSDGIRVDDRVKPELLAMGQETATVSPFDADAYTTSSGTSLATPVLAGAVACLVQAHPGWTLSEVHQALFRSGDYFIRHGQPDQLLIRGYGIPDVARAAGITGSGKRRP
jgi:subtilisin family serine protease